MKKIFVVGCSRSGTSVVQKQIVEKTRLFSLPETAFFSMSNGSKKDRTSNLARLIKYTGVFDIRKINFNDSNFDFLKVFGIPVDDYLDYGKYEHKVFNDILTMCARLKGYEGWVEKTPLHFLRLDEILHNINDAIVVFVIRNGLDVAASIRDRANKFEEFSHQKDFRIYTKIWNQSLYVAQENLGNDRVVIFDFDKFVQSPNEYLTPVLSKINNFDFKDNFEGNELNIVNDNERWKKNINSPVAPQKSRVHDVFSESEIESILESLDLECYNRVVSKP